jgi:hypothetical protein
MEDYVIQPKEGSKGRSFSATCIGFATADSLWESGGNTIRPTWAMFAGSETELRPFMANLRLGRKAELLKESHNRRGGDDKRLEFLKSAGYQITWQREAEGSIDTIFYPDLFRLDPGMVDPEGIKFVLLAPTDWSDAQQVDGTAAVRHVQAMMKGPKLRERDYRLEERAAKLDGAYLSSLVPTAYLFAAYLDRRTRCPLVADGRFYLQLLLAALDGGFASLPGSKAGYSGRSDSWGVHSGHRFNLQLSDSHGRDDGMEAIGLRHAISVLGTHEAFEAFLAEQVTLFFERVGGEFKPATEHLDLSEFHQASL